MAEERRGEQARPESRPEAAAPSSPPAGSDDASSSPVIGPPSVPTRVLPSSDRAQAATIVPLVRRRPRSPARGLRTPAGAATTRPTRRPDAATVAAAAPADPDASSSADAAGPPPAQPPPAAPTPAAGAAGGTAAAAPPAPAPSTAPPPVPPTALPTPRGKARATPVPGGPAPAGPPPASPPGRPGVDAALPTQPVPQGGRGAPGGPDLSISGLPTERVTTSPAKPAVDARAEPARGGAGTSSSGAARAAAAGAAAAGGAAAAASVAGSSGSSGSSGTAAARERSAASRPARSTTVAAADAEWAATSTVVSAARSRMAGLRRSWTWQRTGRIACSLCAVLVLLVTGLGWGATSWLEAAVRQIGALDPDSSAIRNAAAQQGDQNFLVVGSDTRIGAAAAAEAGDSSDVPGARADTVMVVHVPEDRRDVTVVAFPRDLEVTRPECERWDSVSGRYTGDVIPRTPKVKLNTAYAAGGPRCVTKVVQELSGLAVNRFLGVDFQGFQGMVDAVGGVPVCVERPVRDSILGTVVPRAGTSTLSGEQALNFVRARHVVGDPSSDYGRIGRQQRFLSALLRTALSSGTLLDPTSLRGFVDAVSRSTFGENIGSDQLVTLAQSLGNLDPGAVTFTTVPTTGQANSRGNEVLRTSADRELFAAIIDDRPLPGAAPAPRPAGPAGPVGPPAPGAVPAPVPAPAGPTTPQQVRATLVDGRGADASSDDPASSVLAELREQGYTVEADDRSASSEVTSIRFSSDQAGAASLLARSLPGAVLDPSAPGRGTLTLTLGDDFDGRVTSPGDEGSARPVIPTITAADASCA